MTLSRAAKCYLFLWVFMVLHRRETRVPECGKDIASKLCGNKCSAMCKLESQNSNDIADTLRGVLKGACPRDSPGKYAGGFPVPGNPKMIQTSNVLGIFGRARDRTDKNAKLPQIVTQSNLSQIQRSKYPGRKENSQLLVETICEALRAMFLEINHS